MRSSLKTLAFVLLIGVLLLTGVTGCGGSKQAEEIRIGGKNFSEQFIMAEMLRHSHRGKHGP